VPFGTATAGQVDFEVMDGGWGGASPAEIGKVIGGVTEVFPAPAGNEAPTSLRIRHRFGGPMIDYHRDRDGRVAVFLSARDDRWYQYVYQFAHEYCHLFSHFDRKRQGDEIVRDHQWFEESLCEAASLYALRRLAAQCCDATNGPSLHEAAPRLEQYANQLLAESNRQLDPGTDVAQWYARQRDTLHSQPYLRELNGLAAARLLPLFEKDPGRWAALAYLHPPGPAHGQSFPEFLAAWGEASPQSLKPLVTEVEALFGFMGASAPGSSTDAFSAVPRRPSTGSGCGS